ncbi:MAG: hypothetical protein NVSMB65_18180 [Chloroflexota bacterium]
MTGTTLTLTLDGEITLQEFADALRKVDALLDALVVDVTEAPSIAWLITDLRAGSATLTLSGQAGEEDAAERVAHALVAVVRALRHQRPIAYGPRVVRRAHDLEAAISGRLAALHVETEEDAVVLQRQGSAAEVAYLGAYGAVDGRIETLTSRRDLRFTLFDAVFDRGVSCSLPEDRRDLIRDAWGRRAIVEGWVSRDPYSGRPLAIGHITAIEILDERPAGRRPGALGMPGPPPDDGRLVGLRRSARHAF